MNPWSCTSRRYGLRRGVAWPWPPFATGTRECLVVGGCTVQVAEVTLLMASYINHIIRCKGIFCEVAQIHQVVTDVEAVSRA